MIKYAMMLLPALVATADSISIDFYHPDMSRFGARIDCSDVLSSPRVTVDFEADISTWRDVWTINLKSSDGGAPTIDVTGAAKDKVTGRFTFDLKAGDHPIEIVVTGTDGRTFSETENVEIVDDTNGTCPL